MVIRNRPLVHVAALTVGRTGDVTVIEKLCVALIAGTPLSVTVNTTRLELGDCAMVGRQENRPLVGFTFAPAGVVVRL